MIDEKTMKGQDCESCGQKALWLSAANNIVLAVITVLVALSTGSRSLLAKGLDSVADIANALIVVWAVKYGEKSSNKKYPYGYGKIEFIIGTFVGIVIIILALGIIYDSSKVLFFSMKISPPRILSLWVALLIVYSNIIVSKYTMCAAKELNSSALKAISVDNRTDVYTATAAVIGIVASQLGYPQLDPIAACIIGLLIFKMGGQLVIENYRGLLDVSAGPEIIEKMKETITAIQEVKGISYLKTRQVGPKIFVDLQIYIEGKKTVDEGNNIISEVVSELMRKVEYVGNVHVSLKPTA